MSPVVLPDVAYYTAWFRLFHYRQYIAYYLAGHITLQAIACYIAGNMSPVTLQVFQMADYIQCSNVTSRQNMNSE